MKPKQVIVDRTRWSRGNDGSSLLNTIDKLMCCVGFVCLAAGCTEEDIRDVGTVHDLDDGEGKSIVTKWGTGNGIPADNHGDSQALIELYNTNDDPDILDEDHREKKLCDITEAYDLGFRFTFVK